MIRHGRNLIITVDGYAVAGARSCSLKSDAELIEISIPLSGKSRSYIAGKTGWQINISHLIVNNQYITFPLTVGQTVEVQLVEKNTGIGLKGQAIIKTCDMTMTLGNLAQGTLLLQGNGELFSNANLLPSITSGWQDIFGATNDVYYSANYGITGPDYYLCSPVIHVEKITPLCFSILNFATTPNTVSFGWAAEYDPAQPFGSLLDVHEDIVTTNTCRVGAEEKVFASWISPIDCYVTVFIPIKTEIHYPQLEYGYRPSPFKPPVQQQ